MGVSGCRKVFSLLIVRVEGWETHEIGLARALSECTAVEIVCRSIGTVVVSIQGNKRSLVFLLICMSDNLEPTARIQQRVSSNKKARWHQWARYLGSGEFLVEIKEGQAVKDAWSWLGIEYDRSMRQAQPPVRLLVQVQVGAGAGAGYLVKRQAGVLFDQHAF